MKTKINLILLYLRDLDTAYSYSDLVHITGTNHSEIKDLLKKMLNEGYLNDNNDLTVTKKGIDSINAFFREGTIFENLLEEKKGFSRPSQSLEIGDIFIPKNFNNSW